MIALFVIAAAILAVALGPSALREFRLRRQAGKVLDDWKREVRELQDQEIEARERRIRETQAAIGRQVA